MSVPTTKQPDPEPPFERCCFCRKPTMHWHAPKDVAVCLECAETHEPAEVPSKANWLAKEDALTPKWP